MRWRTARRPHRSAGRSSGRDCRPAPVTSLIALPATATQQVLIAGTYGRGIWTTPLWTSGTTLTSATVNPDSLSFSNQVFGTTSVSQPVSIENAGSLPLTPTDTNISADFIVVSDNCKGTTVAAGKSCTIQVAFRPADTGSLTGSMTVSANVYGGQLTVDLSGTGTPAGKVTLTPATLDLGSVAIGSTSASLPVSAGNSGAAVPILGITITAPFTIESNACGTSSLAANSTCPLNIQFTPTARGAVYGTLTLTDGAGTQTVALSGTGEAAATDSLPTTPMVFPATLASRLSAAQTLSLGKCGRSDANGDCGFSERTVSVLNHVREPTCGRLKLCDQRDLCSGIGRSADGQIDGDGRTANADRGAERHGRRADDSKHQSSQPDLCRRRSWTVQRGADSHHQEYKQFFRDGTDAVWFLLRSA